MGISVILPAYQEAENLKEILPKIQKVLMRVGTGREAGEILVVDAMESLDDTEEVCERLGVRYVPRQGGNSYGDAIRTGIREARYETIVVMDADGSHNPEDICRMYETAHKERLDLIIGSRYILGGGTHNGLILKMMSLMVNIAYRLVFDLEVKDVSNSFRLYSADKLKSVPLECDNFDIVEEILIRLKIRYPDIQIKEIPVFFNKRVYGRSKRDLVKFALSYLDTMWRLLKIKKQEKRSSNG